MCNAIINVCYCVLILKVVLYMLFVACVAPSCDCDVLPVLCLGFASGRVASIVVTAIWLWKFGEVFRIWYYCSLRLSAVQKYMLFIPDYVKSPHSLCVLRYLSIVLAIFPCMCPVFGM